MSSRRGIVRPPPRSRRRSGRTGTASRAGPGPASGWYWTVAPGHVAQGQALHGAVIEIDVGELGGAEVGLPAHRLVVVDGARAAGAEHREAVVLAGDLGAPGGQVLDRVVGAVVAEGQLVGLQAHRPAQQLVAEADAVDGQLADELAHGAHDVVQRPGIAGAVGQEDRVGLGGQQRVGAGVARMQGDGGAAGAQVAHDRELDPGVDHGDRSRDGLGLAGVARDRVEHRGVAGVTSRARSRPVMSGSASISARASSDAHAGGEQRRRASRRGRGGGAPARGCRGR